MESPASPSPDVLERVQLILRRDLKLGPDAPIPQDMPFSGSDVDLDSLDILLLVTSIEKEFGVKIPSDEVGKQAFQNVSTLVQYVQQHAESGGLATSVASSSQEDPSSSLKHLPHADPFRFVTKVTALSPGASAEGTWSVTGSEDFFRGHFPGNPLVPGVLIAEALAQLAGVAGASTGASGMLAHVDVRFQKAVPPPAEIELRARRTGTMGNLQQFEVSAAVQGQTIASGTIALHLPGPPAGGSTT